MDSLALHDADGAEKPEISWEELLIVDLDDIPESDNEY